MANAQAASLTARLQLPQNNGLEMKLVARQGSQYAELSELFAGIPRGDCAIIVSASHPTKFPRRQTIFFAGDAIKDIVLLTEGSVKITQPGENGSAVILRLEGPGEIVGSLGSAERGRHSSTADALVPCRALVWNAPTFEALHNGSLSFSATRCVSWQSACRCSKADFERYRLKGSPHAWLVSWFGCFRK